MISPDDITALFQRNGAYGFSRWGRPIAPVVFGVEDETLVVVKGALEAVTTLARHDIMETDPEFGSNLWVFFLRDWDELKGVPDMDGLIPEMDALLPRLTKANANQYRFFRFDTHGAIKAGFLFLRMDDALSQIPADVLALGQMVQMILLWGDQAFATTSPLAIHPDTGHTVLRPEIAQIIQAGYDPILPSVATDSSHALRLFARIPPTSSVV
ncbi:hypothetical protein [Falsihalocynthiibacter arcticus]|uniref:Uncharacterized protein n=1 Tax=Falsihalocynthiibacter arcticus TaxID=1579316 RepID=A0A126V5C9_9RHOB|nr:hypothetical protein [Falsihalocynthiibacter arcticus]AML53500.1 hypothetical protein RC74_02665 [Falsihalocynthiibacter arcticus]